MGALLTLLTLAAMAPASEPRALWVWGSEAIRRDAKARREFFRFLDAPHGKRENRINVLFFNGMTPPDLRLEASAKSIRRFVREARARGKRVDFLCGAAEWALAEHHAKGLDYLHAVLEYNRLAAPNERFHGFQYDVEPYLLKQWPQPEVVQGFLSFLDKAAVLAKGSPQPLILGAAIPRWFDVPSLNDLHKKVIDRLDYVALMNYVDNAEAFVTDGRAEVEYATLKGKRVWLGAETQELKDEPRATFFALGNAVMEQAFAAARRAFTKEKGYAGLAIHWYDSYRVFKP